MKPDFFEYGVGDSREIAPKKPASNAEPPNAREAEQGVLGCWLLDAGTSSSVCEEAGVAVEWFYLLPHRVVFDCLKQLAKAGVTADMIAVQQWLRDAGMLDQVGGLAYLNELQDAVPSAAQLPVYLELVREKWQARRLLAVAHAAQAGAFDTDLPAAIAQAERDILALSESHVGQPEQAVTEIMPAVIDDLENYHRGSAQMRGLATGFRYLDKMLCGIGGEDNNFIVVAARPGTGKTSLALDVVLHVALDHPRAVEVDETSARQLELAGEKISATAEGKFYQILRGLPVAIFSLEMTRKALVKRMVFQRAQADAQRWRTGFATADDFPPIIRAMGEIKERAKIFIDDSGRCTIDELKARARRLHRQHGIRLFVIDYIQLLKTAGKKGRTDRVQELNDISGELQSLGKELQCPFLILAQMNRDAEKEPNREPRLSDLKDCGAIEQDADVVAFLHTPKKADEDEKYLAAMEKVFGHDWSKYPKPVELLIAKARNGPTGPCHMLFQKSSMHFHDRQQWMETNAGYQAALGEKRIDPDLPTREEME